MRYFLTTLWLGLAVWFLWGSGASRRAVLGDIPRTPPVAAADIDPLALRPVLSDPPRVRIGGVDQKCSDCHDLFASLPVTPSDVRQHGHIRMDHGMNARCFNCHSQEQRNELVLRDGTGVGFDDSVQLCAQCHGTVFRDWERGMHGRTMGSWDASLGTQWRVTCVQCHDPHAPAFSDTQLLPGPHTWRMGEPDHSHGDGDEGLDNPLERWKRRDGVSARKEHE